MIDFSFFNFGDFLQEHLVYSFNFITNGSKMREVADILVLWLQGVVEHLQSGGLVMFCKMAAERPKKQVCFVFCFFSGS